MGTYHYQRQYNLDVEVRAGAWGAEEIGIIGSRYHVDNLSEDEIDRTIGAWNMDMAGTSYEGTPDQPFGFWALTVDGASADENEVLRNANLMSNEIGDGDLSIGQVGRSDHQYFHDAGIDAAVFSWMFWAGGTNIVLEPAYHQTTDTLEFVSAERMGYAGEVLGSSAFLAALNQVSIDVVDENGDAAAEVPVAMSCGEDDGWREAGTTDTSGTVTTVAPHTTCDFVALADNGAEGSTLSRAIVGDTDVDIQLQADTEAPVVEIHLDPTASSTGWHVTSPVEVTITAVDDHDEDPLIEYSHDGVGWAPYAGPIVLDAEGIFEIYARATDAFGNVGDAAEVVLVDTVSPAISVEADTVQRGLVSVDATDEVSGVDRVEYRLLPEGQWQVLDGETDGAGVLTSLIGLGEEAAAVEFRAADVAGNVSDPVTVEFAAISAGEAPPTGSAPDGSLPITGADPSVSVGIVAAFLIVAGAIAIAVGRKTRAG